MRLTGLSEDGSAMRSGWACFLAAATITTSEAPTTLNLPRESIRYLQADLVHRRRERSLDPAAWMYGNTRFTAIATVTSPTTTANDGTLDYSQVIRRPQQRIFNVIAGANHSLGKTLITYEGALGQGRSIGGFHSAHFSGPSDVQFTIDNSQPFLPKFNQVGGTNIFDPANYTLGGPNFNFFRTVSMDTQNH